MNATTDRSQLESLFRFQGFAMEPSLLDALFADAPRLEIPAQRDGSDYVELRISIEGFPWRKPADRIILVEWRSRFIVLKMGERYGICRKDGGPIAWSKDARQVADWGDTNQV